MSTKHSNTVDADSSTASSHYNSLQGKEVNNENENTSFTVADGATEKSNVEVRAQFTSDTIFSTHTEAKSKPQTSPLLSSTPPTVAKSLIRSYPYLLIMNKFLSIITWTNNDYWINIIIVSSFTLAVLYFETLVTWCGHLIIVGIVILYAMLNNKIVEETNLHPTLDEVVQALTTTCVKADLLLSPITTLSLTAYDIKRLLFTTVFLTPLYLVITFLLIKPRIVLLITGTYLLTYHSSYSRVTRRIIWRIKLARLLFFYLTGLDFSQGKKNSIFAAALAKVQKNASSSFSPLNSNNENKPVRFTYVLYENQRRWLGIGWTANLLSYERTPWTDEFLNESTSIESFELPSTDMNSFDSQKLQGATWRWVDKAWRLDLTNDGAITLKNNKRKTTANPDVDEGFIFYDNTWKKPSTEDSFSKYTRRRRWIRTAELVFNNEVDSKDSVEDTPTDANPKVKKSLRFAELDANDVEKDTHAADDTVHRSSGKNGDSLYEDNVEDISSKSASNREGANSSSVEISSGANNK